MSDMMSAVGTDLDTKIARTIFGFWKGKHPAGVFDGEELWWGWHSTMEGAWVHASVALPFNLHSHSYRYNDGLPKFSTDNDAAMGIVAAFAQRHVPVSLYTNTVGLWFCFFGPTPTFDSWKQRHEARATTMPEAICRAALLAIELNVVPWSVHQAPAAPSETGGEST